MVAADSTVAFQNRPGRAGRSALRPLEDQKMTSVLAAHAVVPGHVHELPAVLAEGVARLRLVRLGAAASPDVSVVAGLSDGEAIVAHPTSGVRDGVAVTTGARR